MSEVESVVWPSGPLSHIVDMRCISDWSWSYCITLSSFIWPSPFSIVSSSSSIIFAIISIVHGLFLIFVHKVCPWNKVGSFFNRTEMKTFEQVIDYGELTDLWVRSSLNWNLESRIFMCLYIEYLQWGHLQALIYLPKFDEPSF